MPTMTTKDGTRIARVGASLEIVPETARAKAQLRST
jgi:hypothetical protein